MENEYGAEIDGGKNMTGCVRMDVTKLVGIITSECYANTVNLATVKFHMQQNNIDIKEAFFEFPAQS